MAFLDALTERQLEALPHLFPFWAMPHQLPPKGDWRTWVILGGRGAGKTRAGAEWVRGIVEGDTPHSHGQSRRVALVGDTFDQVKEVMVFGESGLMSISPPDRRPAWIAGRRMLVWPNGAEARLYSAQDPNMLRGPQFDAAWVDELAKWRYGQETWDMLQFCLRIGENPRVCVTTTPQNVSVLTDLLALPTTVRTHATTFDNAANLADGFLEHMRTRFGGTRMGRQELEGELLTDVPGAFWTLQEFDRHMISDIPKLDRIVVAVDPPAKGKSTSDECGIIVAGVVMPEMVQDWRAYVLEDATVSAASPHEWASAAIEAMQRYGADRLVAEVNQGGDMVESILRTIDPNVSYKAVHATDAKSARAEPIAALYEQGRVFHKKGLDRLQDQMCLMTSAGFKGQGSPDRVDALVWALHDLMIKPGRTAHFARIRGL